MNTKLTRQRTQISNPSTDRGGDRLGGGRVKVGENQSGLAKVATPEGEDRDIDERESHPILLEAI